MIAQFSRPNAEQPHRNDRLQLNSRRITGGYRVYAKGYAATDSELTRNTRDFDTLTEVFTFFDTLSAQFIAAGFKPAYHF